MKSKSEGFFVVSLFLLTIMFFVMPVVKFNAFFLNVIFGYQFHPFGKTQSLSLFKLEGLIKDNIKL